MAKKYHVTLTVEERALLEAINSKRSEKSSVVKRAFVLLAADANGEKQWTDSRISESYGLKKGSIEKIRQRFVEDGLKTVLQGKPRSRFKPKTFDGKVEAHLIALRCSCPPEGNKRWTLSLLQDQMIALGYVASISDETIRLMLKKMSLSPGKRRVG
jgi:transposase